MPFRSVSGRSFSASTTATERAGASPPFHSAAMFAFSASTAQRARPIRRRSRKGNLALRLVPFRERRLIGRARCAVVAEKANIAAEWNGGDAPARSVAVVEAEKLRAETDRKGIDLHAAAARDPEMAELVKEHHDGEHEQEGNCVAEKRATERPKTR